jgi:transcriptional regulator with XRE-family HTH domain
MSKKKPLDKAEARERRNRMLESAAAAGLSLTEGVREMRAIAGMTQEEFARHRGVSARVIKAIELGQGNPTVATMNRIGQFFGLEVAFVPIKREVQTAEQPQSADNRVLTLNHDEILSASVRRANELVDDFLERLRTLNEKAVALDAELKVVKRRRKTPGEAPAASANVPENLPARAAPSRAKRKPGTT